MCGCGEFERNPQRRIWKTTEAAHSSGLQPRWLQHLLSFSLISLRVLMLLSFFFSFLCKEKDCTINSAFNTGCESLLRKPLCGMAERRARSACFLWGGTHCAAFPATATEPSPAVIQLLSLWVCQDPELSQVMSTLRGSGTICGSFLSHHFLTLQPVWICRMLLLRSVENSQQAEIPLIAVCFLCLAEACTRTCTRRQSLKSRWSRLSCVSCVCSSEAHRKHFL